MWRNRNWLGVWLLSAFVFLVDLATAQTVLDAQVTGLLGSLRGPWGNLIIVGGVIAIGLTILTAIQHPIALVYAGIGFFVLFLIGAALNGSMYAWLVGG